MLVSRTRIALANLTAKHQNSAPGQILKAAVTAANRKLNRSQVADPRESLYVEVSGKCNLRCRFCAYPKKTNGKVSMPTDDFMNLMDEVAKLGFKRIGLTPTTGEAFSDPGFIDKLEYLESLVGIEDYHFFTNCILPTESDLRKLVSFHKLSALSISIYGHDLETFLAMTKSNANARARLARNLQTLRDTVNSSTPDLYFFVRTRRQFKGIDNSDDKSVGCLLSYATSMVRVFTLIGGTTTGGVLCHRTMLRGSTLTLSPVKMYQRMELVA